MNPVNCQNAYRKHRLDLETCHVLLNHWLDSQSVGCFVCNRDFDRQAVADLARQARGKLFSRVLRPLYRVFVFDDYVSFKLLASPVQEPKGHGCSEFGIWYVHEALQWLTVATKSVPVIEKHIRLCFSCMVFKVNRGRESERERETQTFQVVAKLLHV